MPGTVNNAPRASIQGEIDSLLAQAPSYEHLDAPTRHSLATSLAKVAEFLAADANGGGRGPLAGQLGPGDLQDRLSPGRSTTSSPGSSVTPQPAQPPATSGAPPATAPSGGGGGAVGRVGEVARATLNAIDFPQFVSALIQGTFQAIVDASIQQMEAYAKLLQSVGTTVDRFMEDEISEGQAKDHLVEQYGGMFTRDGAGAQASVKVRPDDSGGGEVPSFLKDLGFNSRSDVDDDAVKDVIVPATRRRIAEQRQQTLATMVLLGINRVVVDDGEITAKLMFHIDASDQTTLKFDQTKTTAGNMAGRAGTNPFSAQALMVNTVSLNTQSDVNVRADLTGQVKVKFRSETFPLARFADSNAIQLINSNAKVPQPAAAVAPAPAAPVAAAPTAPVPAATPATPAAPAAPATPPAAAAPPTPAPAPASQGLAAVGMSDDPWAPET